MIVPDGYVVPIELVEALQRPKGVEIVIQDGDLHLLTPPLRCVTHHSMTADINRLRALVMIGNLAVGEAGVSRLAADATDSTGRHLSGRIRPTREAAR